MYDMIPFFQCSLSIPVTELENGPPRCNKCKHVIGDFFVEYDGISKFYCDHCHTQRVLRVHDWAIRYAGKHCKITSLLPIYEDEYDHFFDSEEHHRAECRHSCTNYDELIARLNNEYDIHKVIYEVIRARIDELVDQAIATGPFCEAEDDVELA